MRKRIEKAEDIMHFNMNYKIFKILFTPDCCQDIPTTTIEDFDFFDKKFFHLVFQDEYYFRINHFCILFVKYRCSISEIYKIWRENSECSYIRLDHILRLKLR